MDHNIITERASFFRSAARMELKGQWIKAVLASAVFVVIVGIIDFIVTTFVNNTATQSISSIYTLLVYGPATAGFVAFFINLVRRNDPKVSDCFDGFYEFGRTLVLGLLILLFTTLWTMLFVIPGIVASYRYSMAFAIAKDRPELGAMDCIRESKRIMMGNKARKFCVDFSFIGWTLLSIVPGSVILGVLVAFNPDMSIALINVLATILTIPILWVIAYQQTADIVFYEELIRPVVHTGYQYQQYNPQDEPYVFNDAAVNESSVSEDAQAEATEAAGEAEEKQETEAE